MNKPRRNVKIFKQTKMEINASMTTRYKQNMNRDVYSSQ